MIVSAAWPTYQLLTLQYLIKFFIVCHNISIDEALEDGKLVLIYKLALPASKL